MNPPLYIVVFSIFKISLVFLERKIILFIYFHNITKGQEIVPCPYIVVLRAILFLTHVLLYTLLVLSQVESDTPTAKARWVLMYIDFQIYSKAYKTNLFP